MMHLPKEKKRDNEKAIAPASRWVEPRLTRLSAGSAEQNPNPLSDSNGEFS